METRRGSIVRVDIPPTKDDGNAAADGGEKATETGGGETAAASAPADDLRRRMFNARRLTRRKKSYYDDHFPDLSAFLPGRGRSRQHIFLIKRLWEPQALTVLVDLVVTLRDAGHHVYVEHNLVRDVTQLVKDTSGEDVPKNRHAIDTREMLDHTAATLHDVGTLTTSYGQYRISRAPASVDAAAQETASAAPTSTLVLPDDLEHDPRRASYDEDEDDPDMIDFVVALGGDGTVSYLLSTYLQNMETPAIASFAFGSLGFLTPFRTSVVESVVHMLENPQSYKVDKRMRLNTKLLFPDAACDPGEHECDSGEAVTDMTGSMHRVMNTRGWDSLNEVHITRGHQDGMLSVDLALMRNDCPIEVTKLTNISGDGVLVSTPTGSSAYAMSVGAPLVQPDANVMVVSAIAPFSFSFRPLVLSAAYVVKVTISPLSRVTPILQFDGGPKPPFGTANPAGIQMLRHKDGKCPELIISKSPFYVHSVVGDPDRGGGPSGDAGPVPRGVDPNVQWINSLSRMGYNIHGNQKEVGDSKL